MKVWQSSTFKNSYPGLLSFLQNHRAGFECPCFLAEESFFQSEWRALGAKQGLLWPGRAGGLAEPWPLQETPLSHANLFLTWTSGLLIHRLLCLGQVWFPSRVVPNSCSGTSLSHKYGHPCALPLAGDTHYWVFEPLQAINIKKHHRFMWDF